MSEFAAILCTGLLPNIGIEPATIGGFHNWCLYGNYEPTHGQNGTIIISRIRASDFSRAVSYDYERFALASRETFCVALSERKEFGSVGWPLLKQYYSSFFAAHAIMRSRAAGVIKLERKQAESISDRIQLFDSTASRISSGTFVFSRVALPNTAIGEMSLILSEDKSGKGVHESFWIQFCKFIEGEAGRAVLNSDPDGTEFVTYAEALKTALLNGGSSSAWISSIRNQINYQHEYEAWLPFSKSSPSNKSLSRGVFPNISTARLDLSKGKTPVDAFVNISCYVSELGFKVSEYIAARSSKGGAFGQKWRKLQGLLS